MTDYDGSFRRQLRSSRLHLRRLHQRLEAFLGLVYYYQYRQYRWLPTGALKKQEKWA
jgi:hypothetical protein